MFIGVAQDWTGTGEESPRYITVVDDRDCLPTDILANPPLTETRLTDVTKIICNYVDQFHLPDRMLVIVDTAHQYCEHKVSYFMRYRCLKS